MNLSLLNGSYFVLTGIILPFIYALYLIFKRIKLSYVNKNVLKYGYFFVSIASMLMFACSFFIGNIQTKFEFDIFLIDKTTFKLGFLFDNINLAFLAFASLLFFVTAVFLYIFFNKKKQFIFTKQRFYAYLSLLTFNTYLFLAGINLFHNFIFWVLQGLLIYIFAYFDIFKHTTGNNLNRFYRISLFGDFAFLIFIFILYKYAYLSNNPINPVYLDFLGIDTLFGYTYGILSESEFILAGICIGLAIFSRLFIFPLNCYYSFFSNSSNALYLPILTTGNCLFGIYLFIRCFSFLQLFSEYRLYFEIFMIVAVLSSLFFILFEKNLKIIFGQIISILNGLFIIFYINFNHKTVTEVYAACLFVLTLIIAVLFSKNISNLKKRILSKQKGFIIEKAHIFLFEKLLYKISDLFNCIINKIVINIVKLVVFILDFIVSVLFVNLLKNENKAKNLRYILLIFAMLIIMTFAVLYFSNAWGI